MLQAFIVQNSNTRAGYHDPGRSSKNRLPNFGTIWSGAIDSSDSNSHLGGDTLPANSLGAHRGNPLCV
jgi:hypothetical protein